MKRTISAEVGKGSVNHNSRKFKAENVDGSRTHLNIDYCNERIQTVYHQLFDHPNQTMKGGISCKMKSMKKSCL